MKRIVHGCAACALAFSALAFGATPSPYAGEQQREIKALSSEEVAALVAGKGMGLAKAAELNGYPGPAHVLELAQELKLTESQKMETQSLFQAMEAKSSSLGKALVDEERKLDRQFAGRTVTQDSLAAALARIGELQARVRGAHLEAHLAQARILTPEQNAHYAQLRGYTAPAAATDHGEGHHHH